MSKTVKAIIACGSILTLLIVTVILLISLNKDNNGNTGDLTDTGNAPETILTEWNLRFAEEGKKYSEARIKTIDVTNENGKLHVYSTGADDENPYSISGFESHKINYSLLNNMPGSTVNMDIAAVIEEDASDIGKYGLTNPRSEITITFDDNAEMTFLIGNLSPNDAQTYICFKGDSKVYTAYTTYLNAYFAAPEYYLSLVVIDEVTDAEYGMAEMRIWRREYEYDVVFSYDEERKSGDYTGGTATAYVLAEPFFAYLDLKQSVAYTNHLFGLTADLIVMLDPGEDELLIAGFDDPDAVITMDTRDGKHYELKLVKKTEGDDSEDPLYFGYVEGGENIIYGFTESKLIWVTLDFKDVISNLIIGEYFYSLKTMDIKAEGAEDMHFSSTGSDKNDFVTSLNGSSENFTERYIDFYDFLLNTAAEEVYMKDIEGDPVAEINIENVRGRVTNLKFYRDTDSRKLVIKVNDVTSFRCRSSYLDVLKHNMQIFNDESKSFITTW